MPEDKFGIVLRRKEESNTKIAVGKTNNKNKEDAPAPTKVNKPQVEKKDEKLDDILDEFDN